MLFLKMFSVISGLVPDSCANVSFIREGGEGKIFETLAKINKTSVSNVFILLLLNQ
jgi:hypothetical protein